MGMTARFGIWVLLAEVISGLGTPSVLTDQLKQDKGAGFKVEWSGDKYSASRGNSTVEITLGTLAEHDAAGVLAGNNKFQDWTKSCTLNTPAEQGVAEVAPLPNV